MLVGGFTALLAFDELFLLHESVAPDHLGIPEEGFYVLYPSLGLVALRLLVGQLGFRNSAGVFVALGSLGVSAAIDIFVPRGSTIVARAGIPKVVVEDLFKLAGWAARFGFWTSLAFQILSKRLAAQA